jgi:NADH dehydrogenase [ubiquinone] 1 alpha subcomplex assembly factor 5
MFELMNDLRAMGESNCIANRTKYTSRNTFLAANEIYKSVYGKDGKIPATFQIIFLIGWKPSKTQSQPLARGSAKFSLKETFDTKKIDFNQAKY